MCRLSLKVAVKMSLGVLVDGARVGPNDTTLTSTSTKLSSNLKMNLGVEVDDAPVTNPQ